MNDVIVHATLKAKQRAIRDGFPETMGLRVHRAISWVGRAEDCGDDHDARFIFLWIAFNAAYADCLSRSLRYAQHMVPPRPRPFPSVCDDCGECPTILGVGPVNNQGSMEALTLADIRPTFYTQFA